jgi:hypothetical protein
VQDVTGLPRRIGISQKQLFFGIMCQLSSSQISVQLRCRFKRRTIKFIFFSVWKIKIMLLWVSAEHVLAFKKLKIKCIESKTLRNLLHHSDFEKHIFCVREPNLVENVWTKDKGVNGKR